MAMALAVGAVVASFVLSSSATAATTITVIEHAVSDHVTDVGKSGLGPGDLLTFHDPIYDEADTNQVGTDQGTCIRITKFKANDGKKGSWECQWTTWVNGGADSITVETPYCDDGTGLGAITGGTGAYLGASGTIDLTCTSETRCTFKFGLS